MQLVEFTLKNFRSITNLQISDLKMLNTFLGPHNSGKTNILDGISVFWDAYIRALVQQKQLQINIDQPTKNFDRNILTYLGIGNTNIVNGDFKFTLDQNIKGWINNPSLEEYFTLTAKYHKHPKAHDFLADFIDKISTNLNPEKIKALEFNLTLNPEFLTFVDEKLFLILINEEKIPFHSNNLPLSIIQQAIGSAFIRRFRDISTEYDFLHESLVNLVREKQYNALSEIEHFLKDIIDQEFVFEIAQGQNNKQEIEVTIERAFTSPLWRISNSTIRIIGLAYLLTSSPLNHIIILDEPEMHLHPKGERNLARKMEIFSTNHQILFSTHSTRFLIGHAYLVNLIKGWTHVQPIRGEKTMKQIVKLLGIRPSDSFGSDVVIFVEGTTDARVYRVFETLFLRQNPYREQRTSYIGVGGWTNMKFILSIELLRSKFVRSKAIAITDRDISGTETYSRIKKNWLTVFPEGTFFSLQEECIESIFLNNTEVFLREAKRKKIELPSLEYLNTTIAKKRNRGVSDKIITRELVENYFNRRYSSSMAESLAKHFTIKEIPDYLRNIFDKYIFS